MGQPLKRSILLGFLLLLSFDTFAQVGIKLAGERIGEAVLGDWLGRIAREPLIYLVLVCYGGAFATYVSLLKSAPVGPAYAAAHGHIVTVLIASMVIFGERLSLLQALGVVAIVGGIFVLALTESGEGPLPPGPEVAGPPT
jgi:multidrug transporter EmrE-like cation transporter